MKGINDIQVPLDINHQKSGYIPYLDGLRAFSILLVLLSHFGYSYIIPGSLGVSIFFVISGFIITSVIFQQCQGDISKFNITQFYLHRFFRLMPALLIFLISMLMIDLILHKPINWLEYGAAALYQHNYAVHILHLDDKRYFGHLWSLAVEEHFYLLFPTLLLAFGFGRKAMKISFVLCIFFITWRISLAYFAQNTGIPIISSDHIYRRSDTRFDAILFGVILTFLTIHYPTFIEKTIKKNGTIIFLIGTFIIILSTYLNINNSLSITFEGIGAMLILASILFSASLNLIRKLLSTQFIVWVGKISYSLYIWHVAIYWRFIAPQSIENDFIRLIYGIIASIIIATISYYLIEKPVRNWGRKLTNRLIINRNSTVLYNKSNASRYK